MVGGSIVLIVSLFMVNVFVRRNDGNATDEKKWRDRCIQNRREDKDEETKDKEKLLTIFVGYGVGWGGGGGLGASCDSARGKKLPS